MACTSAYLEFHDESVIRRQARERSKLWMITWWGESFLIIQCNLAVTVATTSSLCAYQSTTWAPMYNLQCTILYYAVTINDWVYTSMHLVLVQKH